MFESLIISLLEADKRAPSLTTLNKIAAYLKKDIHDFLHSRRLELAPLYSNISPERLGEKGFDQPERYEPEFWNEVTRLAAGTESLWKTCRFDTVIIDEAQDFGAHEWRIAARPIVQATDDRAKEHIVCDTFLRYKGLERLAVIVTDLRRDSEKYAIRMNIAISRAVGILRIIGAREEIVRDEILAQPK